MNKLIVFFHETLYRLCDNHQSCTYDISYGYVIKVLLRKTIAFDSLVLIVKLRGSTKFSQQKELCKKDGIICLGLGYYLWGIIMKQKRPVFVTDLNPLSMVIAAIIGSIVLSEQLNLGRLLGEVVIFAGLYFVIWGKSNDVNQSDTKGEDYNTTTITSSLKKYDLRWSHSESKYAGTALCCKKVFSTMRR
ncbi:Drug/metabolite transporter [Artemisia annua]|uniref:WAT1-related protein n=1 Tax=Artemisia annua TaxID=35608 RepID=A0A2U1NAB3_ARTAN|nr:Drug/metabolite transporter [Artemisia annua]